MSLVEAWTKAARREVAMREGSVAEQNLREFVVIDTNAYLSALISPSGTVARAIDAALLHADIIHSDETLGELAEKLQSKRLAKFIPEESRQRLLEMVAEFSIRVEAPHTIEICRDPKDNKFLDLAYAGGAQRIVSGDNDLRDLKTCPGQGYTIVIDSPREYLDAHPIPELPRGAFYVANTPGPKPS